MLYTDDEYQAFQKVRAILAGKRRQGWVPISTRVHPDDADKVRTMLAELESARALEFSKAIEQDASRAASPRSKLNAHGRAVLTLINEKGDAHMDEVRSLVQSRVANQSTARSVLARTIKRLTDQGLIVKTPYNRFVPNNRLVAGTSDT